MIKLTFLGAAETVTGSSYLVEAEKVRFLVDAGMFQGKDVEVRNTEPLIFNPKEVDFLLLTHAHMDHSGMIPKLVRDGFNAPIYMTPPTVDLTEILLLDAAKIQESGERKLAREARYSEAAPYKIAQPLYTTADALAAISMFRSVPFATTVELKGGVKVTFNKVGHILGAASILIEVEGKKLIFSGDLGRSKKEQSLISTFPTNEPNKSDIDYIIMESLYGGVNHPDKDHTLNRFLEVINTTLKRDGNVVIPCFAVHRTQEILEILHIALKTGKLATNVQIFVDSPLAQKATRIYTKNSTYLTEKVTLLNKTYFFRGKTSKEESREQLSNANRFEFDNVRTVKSHKESLSIAKYKRAIIIAGSGMAEGGRILHHLATNLPGRQNTVLFVGFQAEGTMGRKIVDGIKRLKINKKKIKVAAEVIYLTGFSGHADDKGLLSWLANYNSNVLKKVFLVHAEPDRSKAFKSELDQMGINNSIPAWKETEVIN